MVILLLFIVRPGLRMITLNHVFSRYSDTKHYILLFTEIVRSLRFAGHDFRRPYCIQTNSNEIIMAVSVMNFESCRNTELFFWLIWKILCGVLVE